MTENKEWIVIFLVNENRCAYRANDSSRLEVELQTLRIKPKRWLTDIAIVECAIAVSAPLVWAPNGADTNVHDLL